MNSNNSSVRIYFAGEDLILDGDIPERILKGFYYRKTTFYRLYPKDYTKLIKTLKQSNITFKVDFSTDFSLKKVPNFPIELYDHQKEAIEHWAKNQYQGTVILPTGSGKSYVGLAAITRCMVRTLIIVPTLDLIDQWVSVMKEISFYPSNLVGKFGGGKKEITDITVITYESARLYLKRLRQLFGLLIFDEVHHLSGEQWQDIARGYIAPFKLGLTATLTISDTSYQPVIDLVGSIVYQRSPTDMKELGTISDFIVRKKYVQLSPEDLEEYNRCQEIFSNYLVKKGLRGKEGFQRLIFLQRYSDARRALAAFHRKTELSFNAKGKIDAIREILEQHPTDTILLFCESIEFIERVSERFLIPVVSSKTSPKERRYLISAFKEGSIRILAAGKVLDEGIDVTSANVGIVVSGTSQKRQFIQRLGRLLRKSPDKEVAILYEILSSETTEIRTSYRRSKI